MYNNIVKIGLRSSPVPDPDQIQIRRGPVSKNIFFRPFRLQFNLKLRGGGVRQVPQAPPLDPPLKPGLFLCHWGLLFCELCYFLYVYLCETFPVSKLLEYCNQRSSINTSKDPPKRALCYSISHGITLHSPKPQLNLVLRVLSYPSLWVQTKAGRREPW